MEDEGRLLDTNDTAALFRGMNPSGHTLRNLCAYCMYSFAGSSQTESLSEATRSSDSCLITGTGTSIGHLKPHSIAAHNKETSDIFHIVRTRVISLLTKSHHPHYNIKPIPK